MPSVTLAIKTKAVHEPLCLVTRLNPRHWKSPADTTTEETQKALTVSCFTYHRDTLHSRKMVSET